MDPFKVVIVEDVKTGKYAVPVGTLLPDGTRTTAKRYCKLDKTASEGVLYRNNEYVSAKGNYFYANDNGLLAQGEVYSQNSGILRYYKPDTLAAKKTGTVKDVPNMSDGGKSVTVTIKNFVATVK